MSEAYMGRVEILNKLETLSRSPDILKVSIFVRVELVV